MGVVDAEGAWGLVHAFEVAGMLFTRSRGAGAEALSTRLRRGWAMGLVDADGA